MNNWNGKGIDIYCYHVAIVFLMRFWPKAQVSLAIADGHATMRSAIEM